jgi:hypothetical protein
VDKFFPFRKRKDPPLEQRIVNLTTGKIHRFAPKIEYGEVKEDLWYSDCYKIRGSGPLNKKETYLFSGGRYRVTKGEVSCGSCINRASGGQLLAKNL